MSNWPEIGVYRGWGARRDSGAAVRELGRGRLSKLLVVAAELLRGFSGAGMPFGGGFHGGAEPCAAELGEAGWRWVLAAIVRRGGE